MKKSRKKAWEHVKPSRYMSKEEYKRKKRDMMLLAPDKRELVYRPGVTPHPKMVNYINLMADGETRYRTRTAPFIGTGKSNATKPYYSKRGGLVRTSYTYTLKADEKKKCIKYVQEQIKNANFTDANKAKRIEEKIVAKILAAKPNTTVVVDPRRIYKEKWQSTITFTDSMFQRVIRQRPKDV